MHSSLLRCASQYKQGTLEENNAACSRHDYTKSVTTTACDMLGNKYHARKERK